MPVLSFAGCSCFIGGLAEPLDEGADIAFGLGEAGLVGADEGVVVGGLVGDFHLVGIEDPGGARLLRAFVLWGETVTGGGVNDKKHLILVFGQRHVGVALDSNAEIIDAHEGSESFICWRSRTGGP